MKQWTKSLTLGLGSVVTLTTLLLGAPLAAQNHGQNDQGGNSQGENNQGKDDQGKDDQGKNNQEKNNQDENSQGGKSVPTPEPATLTLIALGGGAASLMRYHKSRRSK